MVRRSFETRSETVGLLSSASQWMHHCGFCSQLSKRGWLQRAVSLSCSPAVLANKENGELISERRTLVRFYMFHKRSICQWITRTQDKVVMTVTTNNSNKRKTVNFFVCFIQTLPITCESCVCACVRERQRERKRMYLGVKILSCCLN